MDPVVNFASGIVATAPSPATSGTSVVLQAGQGARFPDPATAGAYNITMVPNGTAAENFYTAAEISRVTAKSTDTLTITRAQESTSAKSVAVGWFITLTPTAKFASDTVALPRPALATVYGSTFPSVLRPAATDAAEYSWVSDGTSDESEINAAISAVASVGAGKVQVLGEFISIDNPILMKTGVRLSGESIGCEIKANTAMSAMIQLNDNLVHATELDHFFLHGNSLGGTDGIYYNNYGANQAFNSQPNTNPDSVHRVHDMFIRYMGSAASAGHGIILWDWAIRASIFRDIRIQSVTGCGVIDGAADSHFENVEIGSSGASGPTWTEGTTPTGPTPTFDAVGMGFAVYSGNSMFSNCKAWYSRGHGFYTKTQSIQYSNCQAQDCYRDGFKDTGGRNTYSNCEADSNNQAGTGSGYAGFRFSGSSVQASGLLSFDRGGQAWVQDYGIVVSSGATYSYIQGVTKGNNTAGLSSSSPTGSTVTVVSDAGGK